MTETPDTAHLYDEKRAYLQRCIEHLPLQLRRAFLLSFGLDGDGAPRTIAEVAERMERPENEVRAIISDGLSRLRMLELGIVGNLTPERTTQPERAEAEHAASSSQGSPLSNVDEECKLLDFTNYRGRGLLRQGLRTV